MGLVNKVKELDNFLNERHLETEFTKDKFEYNGIDFDGKSISTDSYTITHKVNDTTEEVFEAEMVFDEYQIGAFKRLLYDLKDSFVKEYSTTYISLIEKIAFGNAFKDHINKKLETFRNHKIGRNYAGLLSEFINDLSIRYIEHDDAKEKKVKSFEFKKKYLHRNTLSKIYTILIDNNLIGAETKEFEFKNIFRNEEVEIPIRWIGNTSELKYFINLINREDLGFVDREDFKWRIAVNCFIKVSSNSLKKITYKDLRTYKATDKSKQKLDKILVSKIVTI
ncbi:hypothetical protein SAMN04488007_1043 [Maribacter aquivivus]|uniref:Uncharacterized protein n=1 Tax=Maribacter aquivivus TaxID=228958 RepID=A0A1M6L6I8_9FLAO|nr:hypothetical protein [Maribacter aquivivus]SHJ66724.1 hypothetical protein SAMN04488007_1043 [Maribacter aquivivus]